MVVVRVFNLQQLNNMKRIFRSLESVPWQTCVLTSLAIICARSAVRPVYEQSG
jgi:ABC-type glucose/galactose transport system permease subunit